MGDRAAIAVGFVFGAAGYCAVGFTSGHHVTFFRTVVAVAATMLVAVTVARAAHHGRLVRRLRARTGPGTIGDIPVRLGDLQGAVLVAGLTRPTIFFDQHLAGRLPPRQARAVALHERAHQIAGDPLRLLGVDLVAPAVRLTRLGRAWLEWAVAQREIAADRYALDHGVSRGQLAAALFNVRPVPVGRGASFTSAIDLRLQALLGDPPQPVVPARVRGAVIVITAAATGASTCAWFLHQLVVAAALQMS